MCMPPPIHSFPADGRTDFFSPSILSSFRNHFILGNFNCHHTLWDSRVTSDPRGEELLDWIISSDLLLLNDPDTPTLPIAPLAVALLTSPFFSLLLPFLAPGRYCRTWVLTICQFLCLSLSLRPFAPTSIPLSSIFRKLAGTALPPTLTLTVLLVSLNTRLFPLLMLSLPLWH